MEVNVRSVDGSQWSQKRGEIKVSQGSEGNAGLGFWTQEQGFMF
jgi:hypothetical protein